MSKAKKDSLIFPSDDFSEDEDIKCALQSAGFSDADWEWLVPFFKRPDTFGDPKSPSVFKDDFTDAFEVVLPSIVEKLSEPVETEKDAANASSASFQFPSQLRTEI